MWKDVRFDYNGEIKSCKSGLLKIMLIETRTPFHDASSQFSPPVRNSDTRNGVVTDIAVI